METETIVVVNATHTPASKCSDYDEDCFSVVNPTACWVGNEAIGMADGYCPLMLTKESE